MNGYLLANPLPPVLSVNNMTGDVIIPIATTSQNGLLSITDKKYLDTLYPSLRLVTSNPTATISVSKDNVTYTGVNDNGVWTFNNLPTFGDYTVSYTLDGVTQTYTKTASFIGINEYKINYTYTITADDINKGTFMNCSPTILSNQTDNSAGFTIVGSNSSSATAGLLRWDYSLDFTYVSSISFLGRKNVNHGMIIAYITDGLNTSSVKTYASISQHYNTSSANTWYKFTIDTTGITGTHILSLVGGYTDATGAAASSTSYCNIIISY